MKTYVLIDLKSFLTHITVEVKEKPITKKIEFHSGSRSQGQLVPGVLHTDDPDIQKHLEDSPFYNKKWKLKPNAKETGLKVTSGDDSQANAEADNANSDANDSQSSDENQGDKDSAMYSEDVTTMTQAKAYVLEHNKDIDPTELQGNKADLIAKVKELGYNFPNFK